MTFSAIAKLLLRRPFRRFRFQLPDDLDVTVERPDQVEYQQGSEIIVVKTIDDAEIIIDLRLVVRVDVLPPQGSDERVIRE
jgi:hypothetical protein